jgi:hypothetical protein
VRSDGRPLFGFAAAVLVLDALLWTYHPRALVGLLLALPAAVAVVGGVVLAGARRPDGSLRVVPELSLATTLVAVALAVVAVAAIFGLWLLLIGAGLAALGAGGLVRELRAGARVRSWR